MCKWFIKRIIPVIIIKSCNQWTQLYKGAQVSPSYEHVAFIYKKGGICQQLKGYAVICSCIYKRSGVMSAIKNYTVSLW